MSKNKFNPLLPDEFQLLSVSSTGTVAQSSSEQVTEVYTVLNESPKDTQFSIDLQNSVGDTSILVLAPTPIIPDNLDTIVGTNTVEFTPYYPLEVGEQVIVTYSKATDTPVTPHTTLSGAITATVNPDGSVDIGLPVNNTAAVPENVIVPMEITDGGTNTQTRTTTLSIPPGASTPTQTFTGLPAATYTFTSTGQLAGTKSGITVPTLAADFTYSNFRTMTLGKDVISYVNVTNVGSATGSTTVKFQKDSGSKLSASVTNLGVGQSVVVQTSYTNLADGTYTFKAFEDDGLTQVGSTSTLTVSTASPIALGATSFGVAYADANSFITDRSAVVWQMEVGNYYVPYRQHRTWIYYDTSAISGTVTGAYILFNRPTYAQTEYIAGTQYICSESSYTTRPNAYYWWSDISGTSYRSPAVPTIIDNYKMRLDLNAAAIAKINQKNGLYIMIYNNASTLHGKIYGEAPGSLILTY